MKKHNGKYEKKLFWISITALYACKVKYDVAENLKTQFIFFMLVYNKEVQGLGFFSRFSVDLNLKL